MTTPASAPRESAQPEPDVRAKTSDEQVEDEILGGRGALAGLRVGGNLFHGGQIHVLGDFNVGASGGRPGLPTADLTDAVAAQAESFVAPPFFTALLETIQRRRLVVLTGIGCGTRTAGEAALHQAGLRPIIQLPADVPARELVAGIEQLCRQNRTAGMLIDSIDGETLAGLARFELRRLTAALADRAALVLTTSTHPASPGEVMTIAGSPPDAAAVVRAAARQRGEDEDVVELALAALQLLGRAASPGEAVGLVDRASGANVSAEELAALLDGQPGVLDDWLSRGPSAGAIASLAAVATLDGVPRIDVDDAAQRLLERLTDGREASEQSIRLGRREPEAVAEVARESFSTHFGRQSADVLRLRAPHTRDRVVGFLWDRLGGGFQRCYLQWLRDLGTHPDRRIREGAAITAGILFAFEPIVTEAELLRPWALDGGARERGCAGLALGVPVAIDADPAPARTLVKGWGLAANRALQLAAVTAYGGLLGEWDPGSAAPMHLWIIGEDSPELAHAADASLAALVAAGADAARARATVLGVLAAMLDLDPVPRRVYEVLLRVVTRLTADGAAARESLASLVEDEPESLAALAAVFARAFDASTGHASARAALRQLLLAVQAGVCDVDELVQLIRAMKVAAQRRRRLAAFGSQLERALRAEARAPAGAREAATSVHQVFFPPITEGS